MSTHRLAVLVLAMVVAVCASVWWYLASDRPAASERLARPPGAVRATLAETRPPPCASWTPGT